MLNKRTLNKVERLRAEAKELWLLSETHKKLDLEYCTYERIVTTDQDPIRVNRYSELLINKGAEYDNARIAFIDNYIFSRI